MRPKHVIRFVIIIIVFFALISFFESKRFSDVKNVYNGRVDSNNQTQSEANTGFILLETISKYMFISLRK